MKIIYFILLLLLSLNAVAENSASEFGKILLNKGPQFHNVPLRKVEYRDLNNDGQPEILLHINRIEENAIGFLNSEIYNAFVWIEIYSKHNRKYSLNTHKYKEFVKERIAFYNHWLQAFENPINLENDSKNLIKSNYTLFKKTLTSYINELE